MEQVTVAHDDIEDVALVPERALGHYADLGWYRVEKDDEGEWRRVHAPLQVAAPQQAAADGSADPGPEAPGALTETTPVVTNQES